MQHLGVLSVTMFHGCSVTRRSGDQIWVISEQGDASKKVWLLLAYLLWSHNKPVSRSTLIDLLWSNEEVADPANALKALLFRVRNLLGRDGLGFEDTKNILLYQGGSYLWHKDLRIELDIEQFERNIAAAAHHTPDTALSYILAATDLYTGMFLSQTAENDWITPLSAYFHAKFLKACAHAIDLLQEAQRHDDIIHLCRSALIIEPYDEVLHTAMIRALSASGAIHTAIQHYEYATTLFMREFGVDPPEEMTALYQTLSNPMAEHNLSLIRSELEEADLKRGPFFCGYAVFKEVYHLSARSAARTGETIQLVMLTMSKPENNEPPLRTLMQQLHKVMTSTLRLGDIITQYSPSQYLLLLPSVSYENAELIAIRLLERFSQQYKPSHPVHYSLTPVFPAL